MAKFKIKNKKPGKKKFNCEKCNLPLFHKGTCLICTYELKYGYKFSKEYKERIKKILS